MAPWLIKLGYAAVWEARKKSPALAGPSSRRNVERENRTCGIDRRP
jgi:hypothetical protein